MEKQTPGWDFKRAATQGEVTVAWMDEAPMTLTMPDAPAPSSLTRRAEASRILRAWDTSASKCLPASVISTRLVVLSNSFAPSASSSWRMVSDNADGVMKSSRDAAMNERVNATEEKALSCRNVKLCGSRLIIVKIKRIVAACMHRLSCQQENREDKVATFRAELGSSHASSYTTNNVSKFRRNSRVKARVDASPLDGIT